MFKSEIFKSGKWVLVAGLFWSAGYLHNFYFEPEVRWIRDIYKNKLAAVENLEKEESKILFIGGSGTHFGIDSVYIEQAIQQPSFNMGLHAGLGLNALLASASQEISQADTIVLVLEYGLLESDGSGPFSSSFSAQIGRPGIGGFGPEQSVRETWLMGVPGTDRIVQSTKRTSKKIGQIASDSEPGAVRATEEKNTDYVTVLDNRGNPDVLPLGSTQPITVKETVSDYALTRISAFQNEVEAAGASLIIALPWLYVAPSDTTSIEKAQAVVSDLSKISPVIHNQALNLVSDPHLLGDTPYHLSQQGRQIRSQEISEQLENLL